MVPAGRFLELYYLKKKENDSFTAFANEQRLAWKERSCLNEFLSLAFAHQKVVTRTVCEPIKKLAVKAPVC
jgi:hypothetical protein